ncbi:Endonuclease MutS2 [Mariniflexile rhizosphaerae]|uniref:Smr/MutS family protein n=1 Tax=unclassified Mariniflexile TaxID=2643887 RepID=UPI000CC94DF6|nr:Smr/MutS family protein [Mariniflexile sp. TRM1-10]AXP81994.1 Endonuclease MutS2 [Mariniflexile sp. TRM1-10]PLB19147.1 MAG: Smr protein [Flavobacteriaceae bacterium FS1-H7996/R]
MIFEVGDKVLVLDEAMTGIVKKIVGNTISIETDDGFLLDFESNELVKRASKGSIKNDLFSHASAATALKEKEQFAKRKQAKTRPKDRFEPTMEVDLHINQLVKSSKGMSNHDMLTLQLETARRQLDFAISKRIQKIVFIHGVGEGVLKIELEYLFAKYDNVKFYDANYQKYGLGATEVYIYQNVPTG